MLTLYNDQGNPAYPLTISSACITHKFDGYDTLQFIIPIESKDYPNIAEEIRIRTDDNLFIIKSIDEHSDEAVIDCSLDLDDWKQEFYPEFRRTESTLSSLLEEIKPVNWSITGAQIASDRKTIEASEGNPIINATPYFLLGRLSEIFGVVFQFDCINKNLHVIDPTLYEASGEYLTDELNLKSIGFNGDSSDFCTRIYPYGKEGLTIASVNDGKEYLDDHSYSNRVISVGWKDERYTIPENLKAAAQQKLKELAYPSRSYECSVVDLAKSNPEYTFLAFSVYKVVTLIDRRRKTRINHQIVEYKEYPLSPEKNVVTLSSVSPKIENTVKNIQIQAEESKTYPSAWAQAVSEATKRITGVKDSNIILYPSEYPEEIFAMNTKDRATATKIMRINSEGIAGTDHGIDGPYEIAIFNDGKINASMILVGELWANLIKTGRIQSQTGAVYFDLDANNGKGELASSVLKGVEDGVTTTARIGSGNWADGTSYQGFNLYYPAGNTGSLIISIDQETSDFALANKTDISGIGNLDIRSNTHVDYSGGSNVLDFYGNSSTGEGTVILKRGTKGRSSENILYADSSTFSARRSAEQYLRFNNSSCVLYDKNKIEFGTNGYLRASIEPNGDAKFQDIYSKGTLVTSDRNQKENIQKITGPFLDKVKKSPVYQYRLKPSLNPAQGKTGKPANKAAAEPAPNSIGLIFDEAPEEIQRISERGDKTIDLYGMVSILWKSVQELSDKVDALQQKK